MAAWTGYMNFSPDLVSSDFAEPRAQTLEEQRNRRANIAAQNVKILKAAAKNSPPIRRFALPKTEERLVNDAVERRIKQKEFKERTEQKYREYVIKKSRSEKPRNEGQRVVYSKVPPSSNGVAGIVKYKK